MDKPKSKEQLIKEEKFRNLKFPDSIHYDKETVNKRERAERKKLGIPKGKTVIWIED